MNARSLRKFESLETRLLLTGDVCTNLSPADAAPQASFFAKAAGALADNVIPEAADLDDTLDIPKLHSNPDSEHKIYLDFDGQTVSGTPWNFNNNGKPIHAPAFSIDDDILTFNAAEVDRIMEVWERVSEDFSPYDVDVTTEEPDLFVFTAAKGIRVIVSVSIDDARLGGTGEDWFDTRTSGVGYLDSWTWDSDMPQWVFHNYIDSNAKNIANIASYMVGRSLGLEAHGDEFNRFYKGHGSGETGWSPIMGSTFSQTLTQWSMGEYPGANNMQDDVAIISSKIGYRLDDHANTFDILARPTLLGVGGSAALAGSGIIETRTDVDVFSFSVLDDAMVSIRSFPTQVGPNLDIQLDLMDASDNIIATDNPSDKLDASLALDLPAGDYFVAVQGVGNRTLVDGYSDYGSIGQYTIVVDVKPPVMQLPGDANFDGQVNAADLNVVGLNWQGFGKTWSQGDFNGDGRVDAADLNALALNWRLAVLPMN